MFSDKPVTTLKTKAFVNYSFHIFLLNVSLRKRQPKIDSGHKMVVFLSVYCGD